jgi:multidrug transporter EmrE-like cation transporter
MAYVLLFAAIALEVIGSLALKGSEGLTRPWLGALMFAAFGSSFALLTHVSTRLPLSLTYPTWAAIFVFGETVTAQQIVGIGIIIVGVVILNGPSLIAHL